MNLKHVQSMDLSKDVISHSPKMPPLLYHISISAKEPSNHGLQEIVSTICFVEVLDQLRKFGGHLRDTNK